MAGESAGVRQELGTGVGAPGARGGAGEQTAWTRYSSPRTGVKETWFMAEVGDTQLWKISSPRRAKVRGSETLSCSRGALTSAGRCFRKAAHRKKQGACPVGRSPSILDIRVDGCMSPVRGRLAIASVPG